MKKKQMALKAIHAYSKSLTDSHGMHPPIVMTEKENEAKQEKEKKDAKGGKPEKEKAEKGPSAKMQEILERNEKAEEDKAKEYDKGQTKDKEPKVEALAEITDLEKLESQLLELLLGPTPVTDSFVGFPALSKVFKTEEALAKIVLKVIKNVKSALKKAQLDKLPASQSEQIRR